MAMIDRDVWPKSPEPKKLAVVIADAGSLGSYEAGVLSQPRGRPPNGATVRRPSASHKGGCHGQAYRTDGRG